MATKNKTAIVTGAAKGMRQGIATALAKDGIQYRRGGHEQG